MSPMKDPLFRDRAHAGEILAEKLEDIVDPNFLVLALLRGGVVVAAEVARRLDVELDVLVIRKVGAPQQEELAMGAVGTGGIHVLNRRLAERMGVDERQCEALVAEQRRLVEERERQYRGDVEAPSFEGRSVCLIDDGLATGSTMAAAIHVVREHDPSRVIVAVPVAPPDVCASFEKQVDTFVCPHRPEDFMSVGKWYEDFAEVTDEQACALLRKTSQARLQPDESPAT